jgi:hypothetical protein
MGTWLRDLWLDKAEFRSACRSVYVTVGLGLAAFAPHVAALLTRWGLPVETDSVRALGVLLAGGATAINAGQQNRQG